MITATPNEFTKSVIQRDDKDELIKVKIPVNPYTSSVWKGETRTFYMARWGQRGRYQDTDRELIFTALEGETTQQAIDFFKTLSRARYKTDKDFSFWSGSIESFKEITVEGQRCWFVHVIEPYTD